MNEAGIINYKNCVGGEKKVRSLFQKNRIVFFRLEPLWKNKKKFRNFSNNDRVNVEIFRNARNTDVPLWRYAVSQEKKKRICICPLYTRTKTQNAVPKTKHRSFLRKKNITAFNDRTRYLLEKHKPLSSPPPLSSTPIPIILKRTPQVLTETIKNFITFFLSTFVTKQYL